jgi:hypothetical protein
MHVFAVYITSSLKVFCEKFVVIRLFRNFYLFTSKLVAAIAGLLNVQILTFKPSQYLCFRVVARRFSVVLAKKGRYLHPSLVACVKAIPIQAWTGPQGCRRLRLPEFLDRRNMKVARLSAIRTGRLYHPQEVRWCDSCLCRRTTVNYLAYLKFGP